MYFLLEFLDTNADNIPFGSEVPGRSVLEVDKDDDLIADTHFHNGIEPITDYTFLIRKTDAGAYWIISHINSRGRISKFDMFWMSDSRASSLCIPGVWPWFLADDCPFLSQSNERESMQVEESLTKPSFSPTRTPPVGTRKKRG